MQKMRKLVGGALLLVLSLFMMIGFARSSASLANFATLLALVLTVGLPAVGGAALITSHFRHGRRFEQRRDLLRQQTLEAEILRLAAQRDGRITLVEIVTEMAVPAELAQQALEALTMREVADVAVTDSGVLVYTFHDILHLDEKPDARGVLE
jgi:hypothetical protein